MSGINVMILSGRLSSWWKRGISNLSTGSIIHKRQICLKFSVILTLNMQTHTYACLFYLHVNITYVYITSLSRNLFLFFYPPPLPLLSKGQWVYKSSSMIVVTNKIPCPKYTCVEYTRHTTFYALHFAIIKTKFVHTGLCFLLIYFFPPISIALSMFWLRTQWWITRSHFVPFQERLLCLGLITCFFLWDTDFRMVERILLNVVVVGLYIASNLLHIPSSLIGKP
jgi:hypothetical protein